MRDDSVGFFWQDVFEKGVRVVQRTMPAIPETGWRPPTSFPNLSRASCISIDTETYDPELMDYGPGWARGKGHIVGVSIGVPDGGRWYFPMRHEIEPEMNLNPEHVLAWLRHTLSDPSQPKIGANLLYDIGWLRQEGVEVAGDLIDVQFAEALLDERAPVALESLGQKYLGEGKVTNLLYTWLDDFYTGGPTGKQRANIYRAPPRLVGPYAESDADLPLRCAQVLYPLLVKENLYDLFVMECDLIRFLLEMRWQGVRVNMDKAGEIGDALKVQEAQVQRELDAMVGQHVDINAAASLVKAFDCMGVHYPKTAKGNPSFKKEFLENLEHPIGEKIREIRECAKLRGTFIESYLVNSHVNGRIYCQFHPLRGDSGGTRSGRYSSSTPNLQNIPARHPILAPLIRGLFIPDVGDLGWRKYDYSQIEYRFLAHFAVGPSGEEVRRHYREDPDLDYHELTQKLVLQQTGTKLGRKPAKTVNFGLIYGMGRATLTARLGFGSKEGQALFAAYHKGAPFVKETMDEASDLCKRTGVVETILGRKSRFDLWEPDSRGRADGPALPYEQAIRAYGSVRRAYAHKALNRKLQGSAADLMKKATWKCMKDGIFRATGYPKITVHDELDFSDPGGRDEAFREMKHIMENAIPLKVPVRLDYDFGPDWGHTEEQ